MKTVQDSFGGLDRIPHTDIHGRIIFEAIREGLTPFKARSINLYFEYDIDHHRYVLFAEVYFPDYQIRRRADIDGFVFQRDIDLEIDKAARDLFQKFRQREIEPEENIILGVE